MPFTDYLQSPTAFRLTQQFNETQNGYSFVDSSLDIFKHARPPPHSQHPNFGHLTLLVFEAVLEVVCVALPGYIVARVGMFDAEAQKFMANMNVMVFTPCLIFTKLASQLTTDTLKDLAIIPCIFVVQTMVSYLCALGVSKGFGFKRRQRNFVIAMGVFGNSNSLPISLVLSLSQTISGLHWDKVPGDNDDEVGARGILYLLIFQQLGQLVRWTWGYNVLLAPAEKFLEADGGTMVASEQERGRGGYRDDPAESEERLLSPASSSSDFDESSTRVENSPNTTSSGLKTPGTPGKVGSSTSLSTEGGLSNGGVPDLMATPANGNVAPHYRSHHHSGTSKFKKHDETVGGVKGFTNKIKNVFNAAGRNVRHGVSSSAKAVFHVLPRPIQRVLSSIGGFVYRFLAGVWAFMNPPLWAMLVAIIVASVPPLQHLFFDDGTFVRNSVTRAVQQSAGVAVPLILVVLGGNLARNTLPKDDGDFENPGEERKLLFASLISRLVLPTIVMAPLLAITAKFIKVAILEDKIFIIVCFLLTGAPTALQLAQICQLNNVYMPVMSNILFQSYVIWILPSTLLLVMLALETVEWAES